MGSNNSLPREVQLHLRMDSGEWRIFGLLRVLLIPQDYWDGFICIENFNLVFNSPGINPGAIEATLRQSTTLFSAIICGRPLPQRAIQRTLRTISEISVFFKHFGGVFIDLPFFPEILTFLMV
ncbi:MAG: hypothetical protein FMNOHCHN_01771 [Ignavibacteriaceae bacterium]|nr:hypothetical protein [Ignavibacteriaceae bacterium]